MIHRISRPRPSGASLLMMWGRTLSSISAWMISRSSRKFCSWPRCPPSKLLAFRPTFLSTILFFFFSTAPSYRTGARGTASSDGVELGMVAVGSRVGLEQTDVARLDSSSDLLLWFVERTSLLRVQIPFIKWFRFSRVISAKTVRRSEK